MRVSKDILKQFCHISKAHGAAEGAELDLINTFALDPLTADDVVVREFLLAHNAIDLDRDVLDTSLLHEFVKTLPGKGVFIKHPMSWDGDTGPGEGLVFSARTETVSHDEARALLKEPKLRWAEADSTATLLYASAYFVKTKDNKSLLQKVAAGIARYVSLGFHASDDSPINDAEGNRIATRLLPPGDAYEMSLVWLGAQPGARATKGKTRNRNEEDDMDFEQKAKDLQKELDAAITKAEAVAPDVKFVKDLRAGLGEASKDLTAIEIVALVKDAKEYREKELTRLVTTQRTLKMVGDSDEDVTRAKKELGVLPVTQITALADSLQKTVPFGGGIVGGNPNDPPDGPGHAKGADDGPVTNPLTHKTVAA